VGAEDEASFGLIPQVSRGWAKKGSRPTTTINHANKYTNCFGARSKKSFVFKFSKHKRQPDFVDFLKKLYKRWGPTLLYVDGARAHKGKQVEKFLTEHKQTFRLEFFPKYTPELNPVEPCWKPARQKLSNRLIKTLPAAKYHLQKTFNNKRNMPKMFQYLSD
jgi:transposase